MYASPVGTTWRALQLRAPQMMSLRFVMVGAVNAILWTGYGMLKHDPWVSTRRGVKARSRGTTQAALHSAFIQGSSMGHISISADAKVRCSCHVRTQVYVPNVLGSFIALMQAAVYAHLTSSATVVHYSKLPTGPNQQALLASVA